MKFKEIKAKYVELTTAVWNGEQNIVEEMLDEGLNADCGSQLSNDTALHIAAEIGKHDIAELLIARNASLNITNMETPLFAAARGNYGDIVYLLLNSNADPTIRSGSGKAAQDVTEDTNIKDVIVATARSLCRMQRLSCLVIRSRCFSPCRSIPQSLFVSKRFASGYHTMDTKDLFGENAYSQFNKQKVAIGELIGFVDHLKVLYNKSHCEIQTKIVEGCEEKIDTVMEYYCNKGRGDEIRDIIEQMPLVGGQQAFLYLTQAHVNAGESEKAIAALDLLEQNMVMSKLPYEIVLHGLSKEQEWEKVLDVVNRMERYGFHADFETLAKIEGAHDAAETEKEV